jgi:hypothetical protein
MFTASSGSTGTQGQLPTLFEVGRGALRLACLASQSTVELG